jgi:hypothetical protein
MTDPLNTIPPYDEPGSQKAGLRGADAWLWSSIRGACCNVHHIRCPAGQRDEHPRDSNAGLIGFRLSLSLQAG